METYFCGEIFAPWSILESLLYSSGTDELFLLKGVSPHKEENDAGTVIGEGINISEAPISSSSMTESNS